MGKQCYRRSACIKAKTLILSFLIIGTVLWCREKTNIYKGGEIKLVPDVIFNNDTDWGSIYYDRFKHIAVSSDGSIFVSNSRQHCIHKFDKKGILIKTFGQKGQGPGDLFAPSSISILDEKYLVIAEYATNRRISIFDLKGNFVRVIKTKKPVFACIALKDQKIVVVEHKYLKQEKIGNNRICIAVIKTMDLLTGKSDLIMSSSMKHYLKKMGKKKIHHYKEKYFLSRTHEGNLLVGFSGKPEIRIYSIKGKLMRSIPLNLERQKISRDLKKLCIDREIESLKRNTQYAKVRNSILAYTKAHKEKKIEEIPNHFYYFYDLKIDSLGNILIMINNQMMCKFNDSWSPRYRVYSIQGEYKGDIKMNYGDYIPRDFHTKIFYKNTILGLFEKKNNDDITLELKKMSLSHSK